MKHDQLRWLLALCLFAAANAPATVRYVDLNSASPTPPFTNWVTAAVTIQDAVDAAVGGRRVVVTNGLYATGGYPTNGPVHVRVGVGKPVSLRSVNGPQFTVIQGDTEPSPGSPGSIRCVTLGSSGASLSGFTLTNGNTWSGGGSGGRGGGVWCAGINTVVSNCVLVGNSAYEGGGAYGGTLINCTLTNNLAAYGGGANGSEQSQGAKLSILINCTLTGNRSSFGGAGAHSCTLNSCTLTGNDEGARFCTLINCTLTGNWNGARSCTMNNCALTGNYGVAALNCTLNNCIVYYNFGADYDVNSTLNCCCTTFLPSAGFGNITNAPLFVDQAGGNLRLQSNSPCINAGLNAYAPGGPDLGGNPRIAGGTVDLGAYEFQSPASVLSYAWAQQYGLPTDGSADYADADSDHLNNWQEWIAGTVPTDPSSALRLLAPASDASGVTVNWQSVTNRTYFLERSSHLGVQPSFLVLETNLAGLAGTTSYTDTNAVGPGPFFYRVGVQP